MARTLLDIGWPLNAEIKDEHFNGNIIAYYLDYEKAGEDISSLLDTLPEPIDVTSEISGDPLQRAIGSRVSLETVQRLIVGNDPNRIIGRKIKGDSIVYVEQPLLIYTIDCSGQLKLATVLAFSRTDFPIHLAVIHRYIRVA